MNYHGLPKEIKVFYCIDTDLYESCYDHQKEFEDIKNFCAKNGYELIWFCHDVEEVFLRSKYQYLIYGDIWHLLVRI